MSLPFNYTNNRKANSYESRNSCVDRTHIVNKSNNRWQSGYGWSSMRNRSYKNRFSNFNKSTRDEGSEDNESIQNGILFEFINQIYLFLKHD